MTKDDIESQYIRVSRAALAIGRDSAWTYRALQKGVLAGLCVDGRWMVEAKSVARFLTREARTARPTAGAA